MFQRSMLPVSSPWELLNSQSVSQSASQSLS